MTALVDRMWDTCNPRARGVRLNPQTWEDLWRERHDSSPPPCAGFLLGKPVHLDPNADCGVFDWIVED